MNWELSELVCMEVQQAPGSAVPVPAQHLVPGVCHRSSFYLGAGVNSGPHTCAARVLPMTPLVIF